MNLKKKGEGENLHHYIAWANSINSEHSVRTLITINRSVSDDNGQFNYTSSAEFVISIAHSRLYGSFSCVFTDSVRFCFAFSNLSHVWIKHVLGGQKLILQLLCQLRQGQRQNETCVWLVLKAIINQTRTSLVSEQNIFHTIIHQSIKRTMKKKMNTKYWNTKCIFPRLFKILVGKFQFSS